MLMQHQKILSIVLEFYAALKARAADPAMDNNGPIKRETVEVNPFQINRNQGLRTHLPVMLLYPSSEK